MAQILLLLVVVLVLGAVGYGVFALIRGGDPGLEPVEPDESGVGLPTSRPLTERDVSRTRFDVAFRGYRMSQVDRVLRRAAYDIGYKEELIGVLEAEVAALRDGRAEDAETLRRARAAALDPRPAEEPGTARATDPTATPEPAPDVAAGPDPDAGTGPDPDPGAEPDPAGSTDPAPTPDRPTGGEPVAFREATGTGREPYGGTRAERAGAAADSGRGGATSADSGRGGAISADSGRDGAISADSGRDGATSADSVRSAAGPTAR